MSRCTKVQLVVPAAWNRNGEGQTIDFEIVPTKATKRVLVVKLNTNKMQHDRSLENTAYKQAVRVET